MGIVGMGEVGLWGRYRGAMVALMWHGGRTEGCIGSERWGRTEGKKRFFSFFGKVVGCGSDGMMIFR